MVGDLVPRLRAVACMALEVGVPALGMCAALGYIDSYRSARLPQNLLQAQRDYFGAHSTSGWINRAASSSTRSGWNKSSRQPSAVSFQLRAAASRRTRTEKLKAES